VERVTGAVVELPTSRLRAAERTRERLSRVEQRSLRGHRGWLMRRSLLGADIVGLVTSFALAEVLARNSAGLFLNPETLAFVLSLPFWVVVAKVYGLYDRDEERTDHSTADDVVGVFHLVTVGS
jgi:hypothetical protein